jgi:conjugal transfer pilus assembly protein TraB
MLKKFFERPDKNGINTDDDIVTRKRFIIIGGLVLILIAVLAVSYFSFVQKQKKAFAMRKTERPDAILTQKDKDADWKSKMESELVQVRDENVQLQSELKNTLEELKTYVQNIEMNQSASEDRVKQIIAENYKQPEPEPAPEVKEPELSSLPEKAVKKAAEIANIADIDLLPPPPRTNDDDYNSLYKGGANKSRSSNAVSKSGQTSAEIEEAAATIYEYEPEPLTASELNNEIESFNIPSGSFVKGVLLTGVDAPTMQAGQSNPLPVIINLNDDVILPNRYRSDLIDCVAIGSVRGDISSERAYIRLVSMSCVETATQKRVVDTAVTGWIFGEDGKPGLRGRLVSKQGALLAKVLLAGFAEGISDAFTNASSNISTTVEGSVSTIDPENTLDAAMYGGVGNAAGKLADFYMDMAEAMFPIIEIGAGRTVTLAFKDGQDYELQEKKIKDRPLAGE